MTWLRTNCSGRWTRSARPHGGNAAGDVRARRWRADGGLGGQAVDALDFIRGVEVFLNAVSGASLVAMRNGFRSIGLTGPDKIGYTEPRANSGSYS